MYDGRILSFSPKFSKTSVPLASRFPLNNHDLYGVGFRLGPGSYDPNNLNIEKARVVKTPVYKTYHGNRDLSDNGSYMVGHHLIHDRKFAWSTKRRFSMSRPKASDLFSQSSKSPNGRSLNDGKSPRSQRSSLSPPKIDMNFGRNFKKVPKFRGRSPY